MTANEILVGIDLLSARFRQLPVLDFLEPAHDESGIFGTLDTPKRLTYLNALFISCYLSAINVNGGWLCRQ